MFQPFNTANPHSLPSVVSGVSTLTQKVLAIFRKYGSDAHVYIPGPGIPILGPELFIEPSVTFVGESSRVSSGVYRLYSSAGAYSLISNIGLCTSGKQYVVSFLVDSVTTAGSGISIESAITATLPSTIGSSTALVTASINGSLGLKRAASATDCQISGISVKEVLGYSNSFNGLTAGNYLDSVGTTYGVVDGLVGLTLDAGGKVGEEILPNPDFEISAAGWNAINATQSIVGGKLQTTATAVINSRSEAAFVTEIGKSYRLSATGRLVSGTQSLQLRVIEGGGAYGVLGTASISGTAASSVSYVFVATQTSAIVQAYRSGGTLAIGNIQEVDVVSVKQVSGTHATQATTGYKPYLRRGLVNLLQYSSDISSVSWTKMLSTVTAGQAGHTDNTASLLAETATSGTHQAYCSYTFTQIAPMTFAVILKYAGIPVVKAGPNWAFSGIDINLQTGVISGAQSSNCSIAALPNDYWLITYSGLPPDTTSRTYVIRTSEGVMGTGNGILFGGMGLFSGTYTATQIVALGGIPVTTSAPASSSTGSHFWQFDGVDDRLTLGVPLFQMTDAHAVIVGTGVPVAGIERSLAHVSAKDTGQGAGRISCGIDGRITASWRDDTLAQVSLTHATAITGQSLVATATKIGNEKRLRINGATSVSDNAVVGTTTLNNGCIGAAVWNNQFFNGNLYAVVAIKGTVSDADLLAIEKWVGKLSGVAI